MQQWESYMDISVILATFGREDFFKNTLESFTNLDTNQLSWELIIIDNADREQTRNLVNQYSDILPIKFQTELNPGKNNAINTGISLASGKILLFTDNDVIAEKNWLKSTISGTEKNKIFDIFGGRILPKFSVEPKNINLNNIRIKGSLGIADWGEKPEKIPSWKAWGANLAIRSCIFFEQGYQYNPNVGPNGKNYAMGSEAELLDRLEADGHKTYYLPDSLVYHQIEPSQTTLKWLRGRMMKAGRGKVRRSKIQSVKKIYGIPRYIIKKAFTHLILTLSFFFIDREKYLDNYLEFFYLIGMMKEYRVLLKEPNKKQFTDI